MKANHNLLKQVYFIGGKAGRPSTQIRCVQICEHLGIDYQTGPEIMWEALKGKRIVVLVKPLMNVADFVRIKQQAYVVWDLHDSCPPRWEIDHFLFSTKHTSVVLNDLRPFSVIPHHHLNQSRTIEPIRNVQKITYIGRPRWCPDDYLTSVNYKVFDTYKQPRPVLENVYRNTDILLNIRTEDAESKFHVSINPGVKLINAIGFGIPSVSFPEPAFIEIGGDVTAICDKSTLKDTIQELSNDYSRRKMMQDRCRLMAEKFHIDTVCYDYIQLFERILGSLN